MEWACDNPTEFYKIMARLIPVEVTGSLQHTVAASELSDDRLVHIATGGSKPPAGETQKRELRSLISVGSWLRMSHRQRIIGVVTHWTR